MNALTRSTKIDIESLDAVLELAYVLKEDLCIFDLETTGLSTQKESIAEAAYIWIGQNGQAEGFSCLLDPGFSMPPNAAAVHGIRDEDLRGAPPYDVILDAFTQMFESSVLSGYNVRLYDIPLMRHAAARRNIHLPAQVNVLDVRDVWCRIHKTRKGNLEQVAEFYKVDAGTAHEGMGDVLTTARILEAQIKQHGLPAVLQCTRWERPQERSESQVPRP